MSASQYLPANIDLTPRRHHGYSVLLFIAGTLFPPLAVAARFGIGSDFWLNLLLTICGYFPGHGHNFYIQNIRNNKNKARTPKWIQKYGLVDTSEMQRKQKKSQWAGRYNDRNPHSTLDAQPYEDGQQATSAVSVSSDGNGPRQRRGQEGELWNPSQDESYYNNDSTDGNSGRWHYPANFDDAAFEGGKRERRKKESGAKDKKDRWARTEDAYSQSEEGGRKKKSKKKKSKSKSQATDSLYSRDSASQQFPEEAEGGLYSSRTDAPVRDRSPERLVPQKTGNEVFQHEF